MTLELRMRCAKSGGAEIMAAEKLVKSFGDAEAEVSELHGSSTNCSDGCGLHVFFFFFLQARREFIAARAREIQAQMTGVPLPHQGSITTDDVFKSTLLMAEYLKQRRKFMADIEHEARGMTTPPTSTVTKTSYRTCRPFLGFRKREV
jgi:hypothetical protein